MKFEDHVILYAKGWYGRSDNGIISDLSALLAAYSNIAPEHVSKNDVIEFIIHAFVRTAKNIDLYEGIREILIPPFPADSPYHRNPEEVMLGKISIWSPDETWNFTFEDLKAGKGLLPVNFKDKS
jgi:hypothetical protein